MLAMAHYPDIQSRAQTELEAVVGLSRLPDFTDRPMLPYIDALLSETLRWNPAAPLGLYITVLSNSRLFKHHLLAVPHRSIQDDIYEGMYIPAGKAVDPPYHKFSSQKIRFSCYGKYLVCNVLSPLLLLLTVS